MDNVLPNPALSGEEDFADKLPCGELLSSDLGGASFLIFITLSTIFVPIIAGLTLSLALEYPRLTAGTELPLAYIGALPRDGEHDCLLGLPVGPGSTEPERGLGAPGLPLVTESGLSGNVVLKFGGVSSEKPGMSDGFHGLDLTVGEAPRDITGFLDGVGIGFATGEEGFTWETAGFDVGALLAEVIGRRVGVADRDMVLGGGTVGLEVGVEDLAVDLDRGVVDLEGPADFEVLLDLVTAPADRVAEVVGLAVPGVSLEELTDLLRGVDLVVDGMDLEVVRAGRLVDETVALEVGVEGLEDFEVVVVNVDLPVGVAGLDPGPPDDVGLRVAPLEELNPGEELGCLDVRWFLVPDSLEEFASYNNAI